MRPHAGPRGIPGQSPDAPLYNSIISMHLYLIRLYQCTLIQFDCINARLYNSIEPMHLYIIRLYQITFIQFDCINAPLYNSIVSMHFIQLYKHILYCREALYAGTCDTGAAAVAQGKRRWHMWSLRTRVTSLA